MPGVREKARRGEVLFGTVDSWLVWKLTGGKVHITDYTNASRTMLYNIKDLCWDERICRELDIPMEMLPQVRNSSEVYGTVNIQGVQVPIAGIAGDQQAALFGQACFFKGEAKNTYGTGCFLLMNTGDQMVHSKNGLLTTIAAGLGGKISYALEGSVFVGGAVIQWVRDQLRFVTEAADTEYFAQKVADNGGVYIVPAFTGLGAPHWDMYARGAIIRRDPGNQPGAYRPGGAGIHRVSDLRCAARDGGGYRRGTGKPAGGRRRFGQPVFDAVSGGYAEYPGKQTGLRRDASALGAAYLAGLAAGVWKNTEELASLRRTEKIFVPDCTEEIRRNRLAQWHKAVGCAAGWASE